MEKKEKRKKLKKEFIKKYLYFFIYKKLNYKSLVVFNKFVYISSMFVNNFFFVHNGYSYRKLNVTRFLLCLNFYFFVICKKPFKYLLKKKKR